MALTCMFPSVPPALLISDLLTPPLALLCRHVSTFPPAEKHLTATLFNLPLSSQVGGTASVRAGPTLTQQQF